MVLADRVWLFGGTFSRNVSVQQCISLHIKTKMSYIFAV
jgi:hypothetical protein